MNDLLWMNLQLSEKSLNRMLVEEMTPEAEMNSLMKMLTQTYLTPFMSASLIESSKENPAKHIFSDTPSSFERRKRSS